MIVEEQGFGDSSRVGVGIKRHVVKTLQRCCHRFAKTAAIVVNHVDFARFERTRKHVFLLVNLDDDFVELHFVGLRIVCKFFKSYGVCLNVSFDKLERACADDGFFIGERLFGFALQKVLCQDDLGRYDFKKFVLLSGDCKDKRVAYLFNAVIVRALVELGISFHKRIFEIFYGEIFAVMPLEAVFESERHL